MPNIEFHGFPEASDCSAVYLATKRLLKGASYEKDVVLTLYDDTVVDTDGGGQPFLRVIGSKASADELEKIVERLSPLNIDIEVMLIEKFVPRDHTKGTTWRDYFATLRQ